MHKKRSKIFKFICFGEKYIYFYNNTKPLLTEKQTIASTGDIIKNKIYYPFDAEVSGLSNMSSLNNLNVLLPVKTMKYKKLYFR